MKMKTGVWIDHRKAIIITISDKGESLERILSNVERQLRRTGDSPMKGPAERKPLPEEDSRHKMYIGQLNVYYDSVIARIRAADAIYLFGPGEAKEELKTRLEEAHLGSRIVGLEPCDKLTEPQIKLKVRHQFAD